MNTYHPAPPPAELRDPERALLQIADDRTAEYWSLVLDAATAQGIQRRQRTVTAVQGAAIILLVGAIVGLVLSAWAGWL